MSTLRIIGLFLALAGLLLVWFLRLFKRRLRNQDVLLGTSIMALLMAVSLFPDAFNRFLALFSFEKGGGGRLTGLLIFSNLLLYILVFMLFARNENLHISLNRLVREMAKDEYRKRVKGSEQDFPIYVIIPAYNEAQNIGNVLARIPPVILGKAVQTLVVVDGATDDTQAVVSSLHRTSINHVINRGGGAALKAGYEMAVENGAEIVVTMDADGQHQPEEIESLVQPILVGEADLVNGSRVLGHYEKDNLIRATGVVFFNWLLSLLTLTRITDCSNAFRAIRASALPTLDLRQTQFHASEMLIEALRNNLVVKEVPITITRRMSGESKKPPSVRYALGFAKAILSAWLRY
jgi:hypothetical protein